MDYQKLWNSFYRLLKPISLVSYYLVILYAFIMGEIWRPDISLVINIIFVFILLLLPVIIAVRIDLYLYGVVGVRGKE